MKTPHTGATDEPAGHHLAPTALQPLTNALLEAVTPAEVVAAVVDRGISVLNARAGLVGLITDDGAHIDVVRTQGYSREVLDGWERFPLSAHLPLSDAVREGTALFFDGYSVWQERYPEMMRRVSSGHYQAAVSLPLSARGRVFGGLHFSFHDARTFTDSDQVIMTDLARQCALAMDRALLLEEAQEARREAERAREEAEAARRRIEFLAEASAVLSSSLDYRTTLDSMAHLVVPHLCDWCTVQMPDKDGIYLAPVAIAHVDPAKEEWGQELNRRYPTRMDASEGMAEVFRSGEAIFVPEMSDDVLAATATDDEHLRLFRQVGFRSAIAVPLIARERTLGVLLLVTTDESGRRLDSDDAAFARELAARAAIAVDNARLFQEAQAAEQEVRHLLEREHKIAERLQEALYPRLTAPVPGLMLREYYQPALQEATIGGDFFDVYPLDADHYALVVADLSGKGLAAAAQVATIRHMLRTLLYDRRNTPARAVTLLNSLIVQHDLIEGFATLFAAVYSVNAKTITYASCGQEPALLRRKKEGSILELGPTGPVLGGFPEAVFTEHTVPLASGDVIAIFTDGLTEAGINRKDLLGISGVTAVFGQCAEAGTTAAEITEQLIAGVKAIATPSGIRDDVCLLVVCAE
ncbi:MAG: SpoIIE family protein phosphatase [Armatimonadota bacterium]